MKRNRNWKRGNRCLRVLNLRAVLVLFLMMGLTLGLRHASGIVVVRAEGTTRGDEIEFERDVAPILVSHCFECHKGPEPEGDLDLTTRSAVFQEGSDLIKPADPENSVFWQRVFTNEMPPKHPLSDQQKETLRGWIEKGARWDSEKVDPFAKSTHSRAGRDWWALQPLGEIQIPEMNDRWPGNINDIGNAADNENAIDRFVLRKLREHGIQPAGEAEPRTLIRRLSFDLTGLPPKVDEVEKFIADPSAKHYSAMVENLLASSHYGERWGRHWLDVVRFGESDGFERNFQRENAWHYRDWVIESLNRDMPYDQFVRMQLLGDKFVGGFEGAAATGFWVAGVHNTTVGGSERMKKLARHDELEEVLGTIGQTFLGLTFNCARCHDHKFDPISQTEYYQLASSISGLGFGERTETSESESRKLMQIVAELNLQSAKLGELDSIAIAEIQAKESRNTVATDLPIPIASWDFEGDLRDSIGSMHGKVNGNATIKNGALLLDGNSFVSTAPLAQPLTQKTLAVVVQLDDLDQAGGAALSVERIDGSEFDAIVYGELDARQWMSGSNSFVRTDSFQGDLESAAFQSPLHLAMVYHADGTIQCFRNGKKYGRSIRKSDLQMFPAEQSEILFGLRHRPEGGNRFLKGKIFSAAVYDRALNQQEIVNSIAAQRDVITEQQIVDWLDETRRGEREQLVQKMGALREEKKRLDALANRTIYTLVPGQPDVTHVFLRGDPANMGPPVQPGISQAIGGVSVPASLTVDSSEAERRQLLADWICSSKNALFARVIVNRVWHYHFGAGIVDTPNDFGFNGGRPTHPELLDYLASEFQKHRYSLKWLHREIVMSKTYRQACSGDESSESKDAQNRWLGRGHSMRLDAESLRDAMLAVSGSLNEQMGGPSFKDVSVTLNAGTTYYEPIVVSGPDYFRRTVYRFNPRGGRSALLDTFDCPDPSATTPKRSVTSTPLQSLSLLNNEFVLQMADRFAIRVAKETTAVDDQVDLAWRLAIAREPDAEEKSLSVQLVRQHGLAALCRGLFNLHEFVVIQ